MPKFVPLTGMDGTSELFAAIPWYASDQQRLDPERYFSSKKRQMPVPEVTISQSGRAGSLSYREGDNEILFYWEFGGTVIALIWGTKTKEWDGRHPWAAGRQTEIYHFVAEEVIRQKAPASSFNIDLDSGIITIL